MYPALAVLEALKKLQVEGSQVDNLSPAQPSTFNLHPSSFLWVGGEGGMEEELVKREGIAFRSIPAAGVHGVGLRALPGNLAKLARGVVESRRILREFKPDVLFFTGGFVAAPMALAGRNIPTVLYVPDIEPGLALKFLSNFADVVTVTAPSSKKYFSRPERLTVSGYPLRADLSNWSREQATQHFGLDAAKPTLLVTGGSKGARSINMAVLNHLEEILALAQVIHLTGSLDWPVVEKAAQALPAQLQSQYHAMPYSHEMGAALAAADLVLSRAGASSLGEYPFFGLPAVLVPYPYAWRYQKVNADYLAEKNAAVILQDEVLEDKLLPVLKDLLMNENKREAMRAALKKLSNPNAAKVIASQLVELAGEQPL
ncbi:MAG: UDP-N-acetylglucosamine--N-acetylmuramyl-(pentapeptide) pyrophosphoryl-undecaprenol N-acetylglucosamine transferase [Chloroflexi bacterium]|nr:UDP-N-acetylglucosamine--N-acetylmuramyl-(pentapeptide) pyrophosphoryl-undecaprenol N-acetylglucosamine transferase [Chloroflexota bacterium]